MNATTTRGQHHQVRFQARVKTSLQLENKHTNSGYQISYARVFSVWLHNINHLRHGSSIALVGLKAFIAKESYNDDNSEIKMAANKIKMANG